MSEHKDFTLEEMLKLANKVDNWNREDREFGDYKVKYGGCYEGIDFEVGCDVTLKPKFYIIARVENINVGESRFEEDHEDGKRIGKFYIKVKRAASEKEIKEYKERKLRVSEVVKKALSTI